MNGFDQRCPYLCKGYDPITSTSQTMCTAFWNTDGVCSPNRCLERSINAAKQATVSKESLERAIEQLADPRCEDPIRDYIMKIQTKLDTEIGDVITQEFHQIANEAHLDIHINPEKVIEMLKKHKKRKPYYNVRCPECYTQIETGQQYCSHCGQALEW